MKNYPFRLLTLVACAAYCSLWANLPCEKPDCSKTNDCECIGDPNDPESTDRGSGGGPQGGGPTCTGVSCPGPAPRASGSGGGPGGGGPPSGTGLTSVNSLYVSINFGFPANENINVIGKFSIYTKHPSPLMYSPQMLQYRNYLLDRISQTVIKPAYEELILGRVISGSATDSTAEAGGFGRITVSNSLPWNVTHQVKIFTADREMLIFDFYVDDAYGVLTGEKANLNYVLKMSSVNGTAVTALPVFYDLYLGGGNFIRYRASDGNVVSYHLASGRIILPQAPSVGLEAVYDKDGIVRQIRSTADGLADVVMLDTVQGYEIRFYTPDQVGGKAADGSYGFSGVPHTVWRIENPDAAGLNTRVKVTKTANGVSEVTQFEYSYTAEGWLMHKPDNLAVESQSTAWNYSKTVKTVTFVEKTADGQVAAKTVRTYQTYPFGSRLMASTVDPGGLNRRTLWSYNSAGRMDTVSYPDGNWTAYDYDDQGRTIRKITPWKNSEFNSRPELSRSQTYSYAPVDPRDTVLPDDARPRMVEERILDIPVKRTYHAYYFDGGSYTEVSEICLNPTSGYGDATNLRSEQRYYPGGDCTSASAGRLRQVLYDDGTEDHWSYEYGIWQGGTGTSPGQFTVDAGGNAVRALVSRGTSASPGGIANHTLREETVWDSRGNQVLSSRSVFTAEGYERVDWAESFYDELRRLVAVRKSNGEYFEYTWNCCAKESETLPDGTQYTYIYDALKRLISKTRVGIGSQPDFVTSYGYDAANRRISETLSGGGLSSTSTAQYNLAGQVVREVDHRGLVTTYAYVGGMNSGSQLRGQTTTITQPGGFTSIQETFCDGQIRSVTGDAQVSQYLDYGVNEDGSTWSMTRQGGGDSARWSKITVNPLGQTIAEDRSGYQGTVNLVNTYNAKNQLVKVVRTGFAATLYEYNALGEMVRVGQDVDNSGALEPASNDRIVEQVEDYQQISSSWWKVNTSRTFDVAGSGAATTVKVARSRLTNFPAGVMKEEQFVDIHGNETSNKLTVDRAGKRIVWDTLSPESTVSMQEVWVNGLMVSTRTQTDLTTTYGYDGLRRLVQVTEPRIGTTTIAYHTAVGKNGLKATVTNAAGNVNTYDYDTTTGRLLWEKNALDQYTRYAYNSLGQTVRVWGDAKYPVELGYDHFGQQTTLKTYRTGSDWSGSEWPATTAMGDLTTWTFDAASGLVTAKTDAANKSVTYDYSVDGKLTKRTWARGLVTNYSYDNLNQLLTVDYGDTTADIGYTYTRIGQLATVTDACGTRNFTYNAEQSLTKELIAGISNKELNYTYTTAGIKGRSLSMSIGEVTNYSYGYDGYGRLSQITTPAGVFSYTRLEDSDLVSQLTRPNGVNTTWSYESNRNLVTQVNNGGQSIFGYTNDAIGNRTAMSRGGAAFATSDILSYTYDTRSEVTSAHSNVHASYDYAYGFDPIGNRLTATEAGTAFSYTSNALNQYTAINSELPTYDLDGNMLTNGAWSYTWNGENRLIQAVNGPAKLQFTYDYMGRRIEKKVYSGEALQQHRKFVYDGYKQVEELNVTGETQRSYCWQPEAIGLDAPLTLKDHSANVVYSYATDANKNIVNLTDPTGTVVAKYEYSPFGKQLLTNEVENPFQFSSEYFDDETELVYYNYRYYNPKMGRWLSKDPIGINDRNNLFLFCNNNPENRYDKQGLYTSKINPDKTDTVTVEVCEIVIFDGHGSDTKPHTFDFPQDSKAAAGFTGCYSDVTNSKIPKDRLIPGAPNTHDEVETRSDEKKKQRDSLANGTKGLLSDFCKTCDNVKISIYSNMARGLRWFIEGDRKSEYKYDCKCKKTTHTGGSNIYNSRFGVSTK